jgi:hypothetical protein
MKEKLNVSVNGHVMIRDAVTNEVIVDKCNAIHPQNMAYVIAKALSRDSNGYIYKLCFGNGGTFFNSSNQIVYRPPNTVGSADLYGLTYEVQVDDQSTGTPSTNSVASSQSASPAITSIVTITAQLNANEPAGQASADNVTTDPDAPFMFDEVGLKTTDDLLLSHLIFSPFEKTANRAFLIVYTLTISVS